MNMRLKKVLDDIQKTEDKILELQEYVKETENPEKADGGCRNHQGDPFHETDSREMLTFWDGIHRTEQNHDAV